MEILSKFVYVVMLLSAIGIVVLVLLQHGKGADMGTGFGAGASGSLFGATGSANFLSRTTGVLAAVFFASTLALAYFASTRPHTTGGVMPSFLGASRIHNRCSIRSRWRPDARADVVKLVDTLS